MTNVGYDLDTSGGLMPLIRALIKPPDEDLNVPKPKRPQHPYYKRPGKGHNHDSCDACGEGGDLICCDRCPASFHLGCYDPPLEENDIPAGLWLCKECRGADAEKPTSSRSSRAQSPADVKSDTEKKTRNRVNSSAKKRSKDDSKEKEEEEEPKEPEKELSPMEILVKAAKVMNPRQFELPREMRIPCIFPGTDKEGGASAVTVDAWGCVPPPARACYVCRATCKLAPLLQCDYCPLLFHQDCLDPPLTALPTGRWMCPNHVEQYIDWKLVNSISATERVALWDRFSGPVDQHAIKIDFIRRARNHRPPFRVKVAGWARGRVAVPRMVRLHYRRPPPLLPSRREFVRCDNVLRNLKASGAYDESSESESEEGKHKICMNVRCPQYEGEGPCPLEGGCAVEGGMLRAASSEDKEEDLRAIMETEGDTKAEPTTDASSSEVSDSDLEGLASGASGARKRGAGGGGGGAKRARGPRLGLREGPAVDELLATVDEQLERLDDKLVKLLAWQRLQQIAAGEQLAGRWRRAGGSSAWAARAASALRAPERAALQRLGVRRLPLPSELLPRADRERIARLVWGAAPAPSPPPPDPVQDLAESLVRATVCRLQPPLKSGGEARLGRAVAMRVSALRVGAHSGCDVVLDARCRRVSHTHALIFCDEVTRHFELINYSEWGSRVNGVLYACDVRAHEAPHPAGEGQQEGREGQEPPQQAREAALRDLVSRREPKPLRLNGALTVPTEPETECRCPRVAPPAGAAWEGSALVPHGALLQFGCCSYVFSVAERAPEPPPAL